MQITIGDPQKFKARLKSALAFPPHDDKYGNMYCICLHSESPAEISINAMCGGGFFRCIMTALNDGMPPSLSYNVNKGEVLLTVDAAQTLIKDITGKTSGPVIIKQTPEYEKHTISISVGETNRNSQTFRHGPYPNYQNFLDRVRELPPAVDNIKYLNAQAMKHLAAGFENSPGGFCLRYSTQEGPLLAESFDGDITVLVMPCSPKPWIARDAAAALPTEAAA